MFAILIVISDASYAEKEKKYFFLDIDDCFITRRHAPGEAKLTGGQLIKAADGEHLVLPFAPEFIAYLLSIENSKLFVWSAKEYYRNLEIVEQFLLPNGRRLIEYVPKDRIFSWKEISDDIDRFGSARKLFSIDPFFAGGSDLKRLAKHLKPEKLKNALLIENLSKNTVGGEEFNLFYLPRDKNLRLGTTEEFLVEQSSIHDEEVATQKFIARFFRENRLAFGAAHLKKVIDLADAKQISLRDANASLQFEGDLGNLKWRFQDTQGVLQPYQDGIQVLQPFSKNKLSLVMFHAVPEKMQNACPLGFN